MSEARTPTLIQSMAIALRLRLEQMHTAIPGEVQSYDKSKGTANVRPLVRLPVELETGETDNEELPVCVNVPVVFAGGGGFRTLYPVKKGDGVLLIFAESHIERWKMQGGLQDAPLRRRFHLSDGIAIAGLNSIPDVWQGAGDDCATSGHDTGPNVVFKQNSIELGARADDPATEPVIKGQSYTDNEGAALQSAITSLGAAATKLGVAAAALSSAAALNAVPMVGGALAATPLVAVSAQLGLIASDLGSIATALGQFRGQLPAALSQIVKVK